MALGLRACREGPWLQRPGTSTAWGRAVHPKEHWTGACAVEGEGTDRAAGGVEGRWSQARPDREGTWSTLAPQDGLICAGPCC